MLDIGSLDKPGNWYGKKVFHQIISAFLAVFFLCGNLVSCQKNEQAVIPYASGGGFQFNGNDSFQVYAPDNFIVSDDVIKFIEEKFKGAVDEVFVSSISITELPEISDLIDPEHRIDTKKIAANLAVGGVIILVCVLIPAAAPGLAPQVVTALLAVPAQALVGAAVDTAITGIISYVKNNGDLKTVLYDSIEAGTEGFKYGAIFSAGAGAFTALKAARTAKTGVSALAAARTGKTGALPVTGQRSPVTGSQLPKDMPQIFDGDPRLPVTGSQLPKDMPQIFDGDPRLPVTGRRPPEVRTAAGSRAVDSRSVEARAAAYIRKVTGLSKDEFIKKYGRQTYDDLVAWSGKDYTKIQAYFRTHKGDPETKARAERLSAFLEKHALGESTTLYRGENVSRDLLAEMYDLQNVRGKTAEEIVQAIKNKKTVTFNGGLTSTSRKGGMNTVKSRATRSSGNPNPDNLPVIREIQVSADTKGVDISGISNYGYQQEVLLQNGLKTEVVDAYVEKVVSNGKTYEVIHVVERVIP
jgi:hypothetical protein